MSRILIKSSCVDCGENDPVVLDFDHVNGDKKKEVSRMASHGYGINTIIEEIKKCEIVCANCHRRREAKRNKKHWIHNYASVAQ